MERPREERDRQLDVLEGALEFRNKRQVRYTTRLSAGYVSAISIGEAMHFTRAESTSQMTMAHTPQLMCCQTALSSSSCMNTVCFLFSQPPLKVCAGYFESSCIQTVYSV